MKITKLTSIGYFALFSSMLFLQGCATMNESDCLTANWNDIGFRDGSRGLTLSMLDSRASACAKHNIAMDRNSYLSGYEQGLDQFCVPDNGYQMGLDGKEYSYICPDNLERPFLVQYVKGLNTALEQANDEVRDLELSIRETEIDLRDATTDEQLEKINKRLKRLYRSKDDLDDEELNMRLWLSTAIDRI